MLPKTWRSQLSITMSVLLLGSCVQHSLIPWQIREVSELKMPMPMPAPTPEQPNPPISLRCDVRIPKDGSLTYVPSREGTLTVHDQVLVIPANALDTVARFKMFVRKAEQIEVFVSPQGSFGEFKPGSPATLQLNYGSYDSSGKRVCDEPAEDRKLTIRRYREDLPPHGENLPESRPDSDARIVKAKILSFTGYTIAQN